MFFSIQTWYYKMSKWFHIIKFKPIFKIVISISVIVMHLSSICGKFISFLYKIQPALINNPALMKWQYFVDAKKSMRYGYFVDIYTI